MHTAQFTLQDLNQSTNFAVSSCTIPLDEEDEDELGGTSSVTTSPSGTIQTRIARSAKESAISRRKLSKRFPEETSCELVGQEMLNLILLRSQASQEGNNEGTYKKLVALFGKYSGSHLLLSTAL